MAYRATGRDPKTSSARPYVKITIERMLCYRVRCMSTCRIEKYGRLCRRHNASATYSATFSVNRQRTTAKATEKAKPSAATRYLTKRTAMGRRLELDAIRGLMLVWITLTHLPT